MTINVLPTIRNDKKDAKGFSPIYLFIYNPKLSAKISLGHKIDPDFWDAEARRVKKRAANAMLINSLIDKKVADLKSEILSKQIVEGEVNVKTLLQKDKKAKDVDFYSFAEKQIKEKSYASETRRTYLNILSKMKAFRKSLKITDVNFSFLQAFQAHLRDELKNEPNTIWGNFKFINTMTNDAIKAKHITEDPFETFDRGRYQQTERTFLSSLETASIMDFAKQSREKDLQDVAMYFLFMCNTGLRISDAIRFRPSLHVVNNERIVIKTQKTGQTTNLFINDTIRGLIDYIETNPLTIDAKQFNALLQVVAGKCGITKRITAHVARHSFGSILVDLGVDISVAQRLLAHGSIESTKVYYHLKNPNLDAAMKKFNQVP